MSAWTTTWLSRPNARYPKARNGFEPIGQLADTAIGFPREDAEALARALNSPAFSHLPGRAVAVPLPRIAKDHPHV